MCEPLIGKKQTSTLIMCGYYFHYDVISAINFYERYRYDIMLLRLEQPEAWTDWNKSKEPAYGRWIWYYTFKDVRK